MAGEIKIIGISSQSKKAAIDIAKYVAVQTGMNYANFDESILMFIDQLTGMFCTSDDDAMKAYLGKEWSYVIEEKFNEGGKIVFKPVRYYLTPTQIFTKLKYNLREIHSDIWVNHFFNNFDFPMVVPVRYPNEADGIIDRGGIVIRVNDSFYKPTNREEQLMDGYKCTYAVNVDEGFEELIDKLLCNIQIRNPSAFTIQLVKLPK